MNSQQFVRAIRQVVRDPAVADTLSVAENPPGRRVSATQKARSEWLKTLSAEQKSFVESLISDASDAAIFGFLCVLDGVRAIEADHDKGDFELRYVKDDSVVLNPSGAAFLHDIYNDSQMFLDR